jgi:hypothetical protein
LQALEAPSAFSQILLGLQIGIQVVVKLSNFLCARKRH